MLTIDEWLLRMWRALPLAEIRAHRSDRTQYARIKGAGYSFAVRNDRDGLAWHIADNEARRVQSGEGGSAEHGWAAFLEMEDAADA